MYIVLPMFHPGLPCPKACWKYQMNIVKKYAVPGWFQLIALLILLLIFHVFGGNFSIDFHALETYVFY